jgi:hypothetical protein
MNGNFVLIVSRGRGWVFVRHESHLDPVSDRRRDASQHRHGVPIVVGVLGAADDGLGRTDACGQLFLSQGGGRSQVVDLLSYLEAFPELSAKRAIFRSVRMSPSQDADRISCLLFVHVIHSR